MNNLWEVIIIELKKECNENVDRNEIKEKINKEMEKLKEKIMEEIERERYEETIREIRKKNEKLAREREEREIRKKNEKEAREREEREEKERKEKERKDKNLKKYGNIFQYDLIVEVIQEVMKKPYKDSNYDNLYNQIEIGLKKLGVEIINKLTETERDDQIENDLNNLKDEFKKSLIESNKNVMKKFIAKYRDKYNILYV